MEDAELDILEGDLEPETGADDPAGVGKPFLILPFIGLFFLLLALFLVLGNQDSSGLNDKAGPSEATISYENLSNEVHTGIRLARLEDFIAQHSNSRFIAPARARRDALKRHEEKAWSTLTDSFYHTEADDNAKTLAIQKYTNMWTPLLRPEQLKTLQQVLPNDAVPNFKPGDRRSRFAAGGNDQFLEGGPVVRNPVSRQTFARNVERGPQRIRPQRTVQPRIRGTARKPTYPRSAKRRRVEAEVVLALDIDDKGRVRQMRVVSVEADRYKNDFVKSARRAARRTRFYPKSVNGKAVPSSGHIQRYVFRYKR